MGGSEAEPEVQETALSREQLKILEAREEFYQNTTKPEMKDYFQKTKNLALESDFFSINPNDSRAIAGQVFDKQRGQLNQTLSERGFDSGIVNEQFGAQQALAEGGTYNQALLQSILQKNTNLQQQNQNKITESGIRQGGINMLLSESPQSTQASPLFFHKEQEQPSMMAQIGMGMMGAMGAAGSMGGSGDAGADASDHSYYKQKGRNNL